MASSLWVAIVQLGRRYARKSKEKVKNRRDRRKKRWKYDTHVQMKLRLTFFIQSIAGVVYFKILYAMLYSFQLC